MLTPACWQLTISRDSQVFMVIFDIMVSHYNMTRWHEAGLTQHKGDLAAIQTAKQACKQRLLLQTPQEPVNQAHLSDQTAASLHHSALDLDSSTQPVAAVADPNQMPQAPYPTFPPNPEACSLFREEQMGVTPAALSQLASRVLLPPVSQLAGSPQHQQQPVTVLQQALSGVASSPWQQQQQPVNPLQPAVSGSAGSPGQQQQQQPAAVQAKLTVRFDSQVPAAPQQAATAAFQQHHHGRHPAHHSAHAAGERVHAGLQPVNSNEHQQWRAELQVKCTILKASCVCIVEQAQ